LAALELNAKPKLFAGVVTQACTSAVTSTVTYDPALATATLSAVDPVNGAVAKVTLDSAHGVSTGTTLTVPAAFTRFT
jgi:hypothetical protein